MKNIIIIPVIFHSISFIISFNISPFPNFVYNKPFFESTDSRDRSSYFGFSLLLQQKRLLVGAPRANSTLKEQSSIIEPGSVYQCSVIDNNRSTCQLLIVEENNNKFDALDRNTEIRNRQWLGASISGDQITTSDNPSSIVCAPFISTRFSRIPFGVCYFIKNKNNTIEIFKPIIPDTERPIYATILGLSSFWIPKKNSVLLGTPGKNIDGDFIFYNTQKTSQNLKTVLTLDQGYIGYSVSAGIIAKQNKVFYLIGAPRYKYFGAVIIVNEDFSKASTKLLIGSQLYEYFGYSILAEDLNGDNFPEIVVSAPYYTENKNFEVGAIYIHYGNDFKNLSTPSIICPTKTSRARFGLSLALMGDINLDGYNDIAVGAPNEENGRVYIFGGSKQGLIAKPIQVLEAPSYPNIFQPHTFGYSISSGVDIDGNGINDIAISAINIDKVFLFKAYPIVNVEINFQNFPSHIMFTDTNFEFKTCIKFESLKFTFKNHLTFKLYLKSGRMENRVKFDNHFYEESYLVKTKHNDTVCHKHFIYITHNTETKPIEIELSYILIQSNFTQFFCDECVKINTNNTNKILKTFDIQHKCGNNTKCISDLQIKIVPIKKKYLILGANKLLNISLEIKNYHHPAYLPRITIKNNQNLSLVQALSTCFIHSSILQCNLWNNQVFVIKHDEMRILELSYDISNLQGPNLKIETEIFSMNEELNKIDNFDTLTLKLLECREAEVIEISDITSQRLNLYEDKLKDTVIEKEIKVTNFGSTIMNNVILTFQYPVTNNDILAPIMEQSEDFYIDDKKLSLMMVDDDDVLHLHKRQLLYRNSSGTISLDFNTKINDSINLLNLCNYKSQISNNRQFFENVHTQFVNNISLDFKLVFDSEKLPKTTIKKVQTKSFKIAKLDTGPENSVKVIIRLGVKEKDAFKLLQKYNKNYLVYNMNILLTSGDCSTNSNCTLSIETSRSRIYEILITRVLNYSLSFWIYVSSFFLGILIYIIIVLVLYKVGFFKRLRQEQVKSELKHEEINSQISVISPDVKKD